MRNDLQQRLFAFSVNVLKYITKLSDTPEFNVIRYQLAKSATSSGANYEESQVGSSRAEYAYKVRIALWGIRGSNYLLRIIEAIYPNPHQNYV